jgi:streptogramin lyase
MRGIRDDDENTRARSTRLSKRRVLAAALCLGLIAGFFLSPTASAFVGVDYTIPTTYNYPRGICAGNDGKLWFTESETNKIGCITTGGEITEYPIFTAATRPRGITAEPGGGPWVWFTEPDVNKIGRMRTTDGHCTADDEFLIPSWFWANCQPAGITAGPDGNLWFTGYKNTFLGSIIGRVTTAGVFNIYYTYTAASGPMGITAEPGGGPWVWFTEYDVNKIGRMRTTDGHCTADDEFTTPPATGSYPYGIAAGPDGNLWVTEYGGNKIMRITTAGVRTEFSTGLTPTSGPYGITAGSDGSLWFVEHSVQKIGRITTGGTITEYAITTPSSGAMMIALGSDHNLWFTHYSANKIGLFSLALAITAPGDNLDIHFIVGPNEDVDEGLDNLVNCKSNLTYSVKINCDITPSAPNKLTANMWEWNGSSYVSGGKWLAAAMEIRERSRGTYTPINETANDISGFTSMPPTLNEGTPTYVDYKQPVRYEDLILVGKSYRHLLTYTIATSV